MSSVAVRCPSAQSFFSDKLRRTSEQTPIFARKLTPVCSTDRCTRLLRLSSSAVGIGELSSVGIMGNLLETIQGRAEGSRSGFVEFSLIFFSSSSSPIQYAQLK